MPCLDMTFFINLIFCAIIFKVKGQQMLNEELKIAQNEAGSGQKINIKKANIDRRFLEDLDDYEWHVAHLRGDVFDGRRDCMDDTFADKVRRYRKMLKNDGARVEFVSADPIPNYPSEIYEDTCRIGADPPKEDFNKTIKVTSADFNVLPTVAVENVTVLNTTASMTVNTTPSMKEETTVSMKAEETTPQLGQQVTTVKSKAPIPKKKKVENDTMDSVRRASEYMFSSIEYYDESIEFDNQMCPDAVEVIVLEIDQLRSYDLECELTIEWRSLE